MTKKGWTDVRYRFSQIVDRGLVPFLARKKNAGVSSAIRWCLMLEPFVSLQSGLLQGCGKDSSTPGHILRKKSVA